MSRTPNEATDERYIVQNLARALQVLWTLASRKRPWTLEELAHERGLNKASLLRILRTLEADRVVLRQGDAYALGPRVLDLSHAYLQGLELDQVARPYMRDLADEAGHTVSLAVLDGSEVVYIGIEKAERELGIQGEIGGRHPAHATALGKVMLADLDDDQVRERLGDGPLTRLTHRTVGSAEELIAHLPLVRERGYAVDDEERGLGIRCVAAPIRRSDGRVIGAMSLAGAIFHMTDEALAHHAGALVDVTRAISQRFGHPSAHDRSQAEASDAPETAPYAKPTHATASGRSA
ncbi:MAG: IclR family transcriptional regulator [Trueperaceae bacterium]